MTDFDVPDPSDWLSTPIPELSAVESLLHCQICKEFYDTPMITSCNHTFCSKCIRTSLSADGKCPVCRASDQANKLRNNWATQEIVAAFVRARPKVLGFMRDIAEREAAGRSGKTRGAKRALDGAVRGHLDAEMEQAGPTTRSKRRRLAASSQNSQPEAYVIDDSDEAAGSEYEPAPRHTPPPPQDGLVECPLGCGRRMKEAEVFSHLDRCEDEQRQQKQSSHQRRPLHTPPAPQTRPQDRINELNYSMLKDGALAKKLREAGIPTWGSKPLMITRHKEWVNLWNANCDSTTPRLKRDLLAELDVWERTQGGRAVNGAATGGGNTVMRKDFDQGGWLVKNRPDFEMLIANARKSRAAAVPAAAPASPEESQGLSNGISEREPIPSQETVGITLRTHSQVPQDDINDPSMHSLAPTSSSTLANDHASQRPPPPSSSTLAPPTSPLLPPQDPTSQSSIPAQQPHDNTSPPLSTNPLIAPSPHLTPLPSQLPNHQPQKHHQREPLPDPEPALIPATHQPLTESHADPQASHPQTEYPARRKTPMFAAQLPTPAPLLLPISPSIPASTDSQDRTAAANGD